MEAFLFNSRQEENCNNQKFFDWIIMNDKKYCHFINRKINPVE